MADATNVASDDLGAGAQGEAAGAVPAESPDCPSQSDEGSAARSADPAPLRCGPEIADAVVPVETLQAMLEVVEALEDRLEELRLQVEALSPGGSLDEAGGRSLVVFSGSLFGRAPIGGLSAAVGAEATGGARRRERLAADAAFQLGAGLGAMAAADGVGAPPLAPDAAPRPIMGVEDDLHAAIDALGLPALLSPHRRTIARRVTASHPALW
jgi:hypothetical protein